MADTLASITNQPASTLACTWFMCLHCGVVDRDMRRSSVGHPCEHCGKASESGRLYFHINIHVLVDLVQQAYHSAAPVAPHGPQTRTVGTVLFFCALKDALLVHFLNELMAAQKLPEAVIQRLLNDNKVAHQRFGQLFSSIVGAKWHDAVEQISTSSCNFTGVSKLMVRAATVRNDFMHDGRAWQATNEIATECVNSLPAITALFAELHNTYVVPQLHKI